MAENKKIIVHLNCTEGKYLLEFALSETKIINLYDENIEQINELFVQIMKDLLINDLSFDLDITESAKNGNNQLACDVSNVYIDKLNAEIESLILTENLKKVRDCSSQ